MIENKSSDVVWHSPTVTRVDRERQNGHRACVIWFTGLSGAGKSTLAHALEAALFSRGMRTYVFDGDNVRHGLCGDLGFSPSDRRENLRRIGEMAKLFADAGVVGLAAFISPLREDRELVRRIVGSDNFVEVFVSCPLDVCETRDVKGMYRRARAGEIAEFTGISAPYEAPESPDLVLETGRESIGDSVERMLSLILPRLSPP
ncbi:MAG: adenylyl-sulfate kinase [Betaproteobacteria bacterium]|jgi:adenylylsulfate kinase|nr:adenylyl-sulfate kinase [Betaproteobacteria bacterium]HMV22216.1 adenylyl-sulfate kinase [Rhodocyclaceae bacterium]HMW78170.1 adenylyl-sulfate kinase [Rhodocyclaceae bacterium]HNE43719.1 adenylyl-sulfate kinase [Rhodocyclaceae bacterium]HNM23000.1 adenylyl-sulfate kinase [Rhodocyclaceae bacterium]